MQVERESKPMNGARFLALSSNRSEDFTNKFNKFKYLNFSI